jgi:hypothetical protein
MLLSWDMTHSILHYGPGHLVLAQFRLMPQSSREGKGRLRNRIFGTSQKYRFLL